MSQYLRGRVCGSGRAPREAVDTLVQSPPEERQAPSGKVFACLLLGLGPPRRWPSVLWALPSLLPPYFLFLSSLSLFLPLSLALSSSLHLSLLSLFSLALISFLSLFISLFLSRTSFRAINSGRHPFHFEEPFKQMQSLQNTNGNIARH